MTAKTPLLLLILDGWGIREDVPDNAISRARTPNWDQIWSNCPYSRLLTSGQEVGLPAGQMGNSEVGHMNIGAGRIVYQELTRIGKSIEDGSFLENAALVDAVTGSETGTVHVMGLLSPGGVHSHEDHLFATVRLAAENGARRIAVHAFLDGRDVPPRSARASLEKLESLCQSVPGTLIASVSGRYYAMDRDKRWDRTTLAWNAIVEGQGEHREADSLAALDAAYGRDEDDEFVAPTVINEGCPIEDGDSVIFINFRADRARQLSQAFVTPDFEGFSARRPNLARFATMTAYQEDLPARVAFPPATMEHLLGGELAEAGLRQLRIAETEKYAHVTYFFNGGQEKVFDGEERVLVPSPDVRTYDLQPEMSAPELTRRLVDAINGKQYPVIICNVANPDMVGHSGRFDAAVAAVEAVDELLGKVLAAVEEAGGEALVTSDHGNVEQMSDPETGQPHTAHTTNPVPFVFVGRPAELSPDGSLRDIAPTMLSLLGLKIPDAMTGTPLVHLRKGQADAA